MLCTFVADGLSWWHRHSNLLQRSAARICCCFSYIACRLLHTAFGRRLLLQGASQPFQHPKSPTPCPRPRVPACSHQNPKLPLYPRVHVSVFVRMCMLTPCVWEYACVCVHACDGSVNNTTTAQHAEVALSSSLPHKPVWLLQQWSSTLQPNSPAHPLEVECRGHHMLLAQGTRVCGQKPSGAQPDTHAHR